MIRLFIKSCSTIDLRYNKEKTLKLKLLFRVYEGCR